MVELDWKRSFSVNYKTMVDDLNSEDTIDVCLSAELLSIEEKAEVDSQGTTHQKNDKLLTLLYKKFCCNPSLFISFTKVLSHSQNSKHIVQNLLDVKIYDHDTSHELAVNKMRNIYKKTYHYVLFKANYLNIDSLLPSLMSIGVLDIDTKEAIKNETEHKARKLISYIYEQGFEAFSKFIMILLKSDSDAELILGKILCDSDLWSGKLVDCPASCPCKLILILISFTIIGYVLNIYQHVEIHVNMHMFMYLHIVMYVYV